jgi:hypothetical protein
MFPVRYELIIYILFRTQFVFKGLELGQCSEQYRNMIHVAITSSVSIKTGCRKLTVGNYAKRILLCGWILMARIQNTPA